MVEYKIKKFSLIAIPIIIFIPLVLACYFAPWNIQNNEELIEKIGKLGPIGDFMGGTITPLLTLMTFIVILFSYITQSRELAETRKQVNLQIEELTTTRKTYESQKFENTFFKLLDHFKVIRDDVTTSELSYTEEGEIDFSPSGNPYFRNIKGENSFKKMNSEIKSSIRENIEITKFSELLNNNADQYYRTLITIVTFIDKSEIEQTSIYYDILNSSISKDERRFIFYLILKSNIEINNKILIIKSNIPDNAIRSGLLYLDKHKDEYLEMKKLLMN